MMDLQVYAIILIVFLVSFLSYLFISKFLPGKSFDEMVAEKKRMREELLGLTKQPSSSSKQSSATNKKKPRKEVRKKDAKVAKEQAKDTSNESDASDSSEVVLSEAPSTPPETIILRKNVKIQHAQQQQPPVGKKGKPKSGILVNKNDPILIKETSYEIETNHFEEIHPKDSVEIHRNSIKDETDKNIKNFRDGKKNKLPKVETPPISPKNQPIKEIKAVEEKPAKRKRNEPSTSAVDGNALQLVSDESGITPLIRELSHADLTKNQIQVLIDFLLNKQSDTIARDPTEWTEGKSDLIQKLKKQLQEKEAQLKNEQDALVGMQSKLKELRSEINTEKSQFNMTLKMHQEHLSNSKAENKTLQSEIQFLTDKHSSEKNAMNVSYKQLQAQCIQMKETLKAQEGLPSIQQLTSDNQILQQELHKLGQQNESFKLLLAERDNKISEFDVHLRKNDERRLIIENELKKRDQELANREAEVQSLDKTIQMQTYDLGQLRQQLTELQQNNHAEENNKIEIRNLQNALDSTKKELDSQRAVADDYKMKIDDLSKQLAESKQLTNLKSGDSFLLHEKMNELVANHQNVLGEKDKQLAELQRQIDALQKAETGLTKQIEEQKAKNNDLRMKNWKLVEALQSAESPSNNKPTNHSNLVVRDNVEVKKFKDLIVEYFPDAASNDGDDTKWLTCVLENLKTQLVSNHLSKNNHLNNCTDVEKNKLNNNNAVNGDSNSTPSSTSAENELILLQNAQLKTTVDDYKNIIAETESMLKNLESKVREQDAYWTKVVLMKDNEIENLKIQTEMS